MWLVVGCGGKPAVKAPTPAPVAVDTAPPVVAEEAPDLSPVKRPSEVVVSGRIARPRKGAREDGWLRWVPAIEMLRRYEGTWLRHDIIAGLVLTTMWLWVPRCRTTAMRMVHSCTKSRGLVW